MRIEKLLTKWIGLSCGAMFLASAAIAAPSVTTEDIAVIPAKFSVENLFEGSNGEIFGLIGKAQDLYSNYTVEHRLFKIGAQGQYSELLAFTDGRVLSSVKGQDNRLYLLVEKLDSYKLYRYDINSASVGLELVYDFGLKGNGYCPDKPAPEYLSQKADGVFVVAFRHDAGQSEELGYCGYGAATLDLSGSSPVYKQIYETLPSVNFTYHDFLRIVAMFEQQGKFYTLFYKDNDRPNLYQDFGGYLQQIDPATNPPAEKIISSAVSGGYRGIASMSVFNAANNKMYGLNRVGGTGLDGTGGFESILFEVNPNSNPAYTPIKSFEAAIGFDENGQFTYSSEYPNAVSNFIKADTAGRYFFGTRDTGLTEGALLFRLDNTGASPVYSEYPDVRIPLSYKISQPDGQSDNVYRGLALFAKNGFYAYKIVYSYDSRGNYLTSQITLEKVSLTGVELVPPANTSPVAVADTYKIRQKGNKPIALAAPGLLKNDTDAEGDKLRVAGTAAGKPRIIPVPGKNGKTGKVEIFVDGRLVYTPPKGKPPRVISFSYRVSDGKAVSNSVLVTLKIQADCENGK